MKQNSRKDLNLLVVLEKIINKPTVKYVPIIIVILLILLKLYLVSGQSVFAISNAGHDDRLFLTLAENLLHLEWLGEYNNLTLAKGIGYPLWISISFVLGLPLLFSEQLLYILGCIMFILAVRPIIRVNWLLILLFALILFNPVSYANEPFTRVIREGIYVSLTLLTLSCAIGLFIRRYVLKYALPWAILLGICLSLLWLTREEGIWILPIFIVLFVPSIFQTIIKRQTVELKSQLLLFSIPFALLGIAILSVSLINFHYYKTFSTVEFKSNSFVEAYGALSRVKHSTWTPHVPLPKETRVQIYEVSPAFQELEPYLEGEVGNSWKNASGSDEIKGGWFMWALRDAVANAGYYQNGSTSSEYYSRLTTEINTACKESRIECLPGIRKSMNPPWRNAYIEPFSKNLINATFYTANFSGFSPYSSTSGGDSELMVLFQDLTMENINPLPDEPSLPNQSYMNGYKVQILNNIGNLYITTTPILLLLSLILIAVLSYNDLKKKHLSDIFIINLGLLGLFISRIFLITFIHTTSFSAINLLYLSPAHIVMICLISLVWVYVLSKRLVKHSS